MQFMRRAVPFVFSSIAFCLATAFLHGQATPRSILDKGVAITGLTAANGPGFHIKANYTLYDRGNESESGTLEEWASGPWTWHRVYTEKKQAGSEWSLKHGDAVMTKGAKLNFVMLDARVATPLTNPLYYLVNYGSNADLNNQAGTFGGLTLDCLTVGNAASLAGKVDPDLLYPTMCFDETDSTLRYVKTTYRLTTYANFKPLGNRSVATKMDVNYGGKQDVAAEITTLEPLASGDQAQVAPSGKTVPEPYNHMATDAPLVSTHISECEYPMSAQTNHESGIIMVPVVIHKDGSVKSNGGGFGGPPDLNEAASDCVGGWKYEPFKLDGQPVDVAETLIITYNNGPFKGQPGYASQPPAPGAAK
ncbi:energy transducer TonB [Acidicapsa dinghuensis]|uniref:Energy transducer TonB n=1 Tax=Acidicapsa dinghuensis TaxID=2218256 RepID=A0ABW1E9M3_9BACT|nr:energy transducer TonB [Acidicapsa dinghuensis]